jgi:hypothetical protein
VKLILVEESFAAWRKAPEYVRAYETLEDEFAFAAAVIEAHIDTRNLRTRHKRS